MRYLFIHQNFPAQFKHVVPALLDDPANEVIALLTAEALKSRAPLHPRLRRAGYRVRPPGNPKAIHPYLRDLDVSVRRGQAVYRVMADFRKRGLKPDLIVVHPGWGDGLFLRDAWPDVPIVGYFEFYHRTAGADCNFDPEYPSILDGLLRQRMRNSTHLNALETFDAGISPTEWQASRFPQPFRSKIRVLHEGIDTGVVKPDAGASVELGGQAFRHGEEIVTYVSRNLEPYRGFHVFMRALPRILRERPRARIVIVGGDDVSYGARLPRGETYRKRLQQELGERVDWSRVTFAGKIPYEQFIKVLQVSSVHVYLTYPFVLSWSMLEAMSAGCLLVGSNTPAVTEVLRDGENGLLVDFFDHGQIARKVVQALSSPRQFQALRDGARKTIVDAYDLKRLCLPQMLRFLQETAAAAGY